MTVTNIYDGDGPFYKGLTAAILTLIIFLNVILLIFFYLMCPPSLNGVYAGVIFLHVVTLLVSTLVPMLSEIGAYDRIKLPDTSDDSIEACLDNTLEYILLKDENSEALKYVKKLFDESKITDFLKIEDVATYQKKYTLRELRNSIVIRRYLDAFLATSVVLLAFSVIFFFLIYKKVSLEKLRHDSDN